MGETTEEYEKEIKLLKKELLNIKNKQKQEDEMKKEPLKNKHHFGDELLESGDRYYTEEDIKSAMEWLKEALKSYKGKVDEYDTEMRFVFEKIDKAFPDLREEKIKQKSIKKRTSKK